MEWQRVDRAPAIEDDVVDLWRIVAAEPNHDPRLPALRALLSAEERARADRFLVEEPRVIFTLARGTLRQILGGYLGVAPTEVEFETGEHGRPFVVAPEPAGLDFNVSHSGRVILIAVARHRPIGADVEVIRTDFDHEKLANRYFSKPEGERLATESNAERDRSFFRCWTRKEAYLKLKGAGLTFPLDKFQVTLLAGEEPALVHTEIEEDDPSRFVIEDVDVDPSTMAAVMTSTPRPTLRGWELAPEAAS